MAVAYFSTIVSAKCPSNHCRKSIFSLRIQVFVFFFQDPIRRRLFYCLSFCIYLSEPKICQVYSCAVLSVLVQVLIQKILAV